MTGQRLLFTDYCWSQYKNCIATQFTYCITILQYNFPASFPCNTLLYIAIQFPSVFFSVIQPIAYKTRSQYTNCIAIQFQQPTCKPHYNTILQYNPSLLKPQSQYSLCIAIQFFSSQPTTHPCKTICCIAIQLPALKPSSLQYKNCIAIQFSTPPQLAIQSSSLAHPRPLYHNTMPFLQYKNFLFHNIIWAVAQKRFCTNFFFIIIIFFSHLFPAAGKKKIINLIYFFHFP